ncbi:helix-turn-helix transcriptional regulator [Pseudobacillus sp. FSL P4-0506]|uniref:helix-turn-helix transcriptional regulator n=1 Tax=Pseudobacillus sp. FSL P4-0506 TaxID=2921576 RepID=UPI0030F66EC9
MTLNKLRQTRLSQGKSQTFMAKKLGYKFPSGYANIEMGRTKPSLEKAKLIADVLGVDVEELFFEQKLHKKSNKSKEVS